MENKKPIVKSVTDILGDGRVHWHEELEQVSVKNLLEQEYIIREIKIVEGWQSQFGENDFALLLLECPDTGKQFTTLAGGQVLLKRLRILLEKRALPVKGTITQVASAYTGNIYYNLV